MGPQNLIDETLFCFALDMNKQSVHCALIAWSAPQLIFFPQLSKAVIFQPFAQRRAIQTFKMRTPCKPFRNKNTFWFKVIEKQRRLSRYYDLRLRRSLFH